MVSNTWESWWAPSARFMHKDIHELDWEGISVVDRESDYGTRTIKEAIHNPLLWPLLPLLRWLLPPLLLALLAKALFRVLVRRRVDPTSALPLPPGDVGWPLVGETVPFIADGKKFFRTRLARHGPLFTTHLVGQPMVVVCGAANIRQVLYADEETVSANTPPGCRIIIGEGAMYTTNKEPHHFRQQCLRRNFSEFSLCTFVPHVADIVRRTLDGWVEEAATAGHVMAVPATQRLAFQVVTQVLLGIHMDDDTVTYMFKHFEVFVDNFFSLPLKYPGSGLNKALDARRKMVDTVRRYLKEHDEVSFLDTILRSTTARLPNTESLISEESAENIFMELLFGANQTTSSVMCAVLMRLHEHPDVVSRVAAEVNATTKHGELSYDVLKNLTYVNDVMKEVLRLSPPVAGGFRKAVKTIEIGGYQIPAGWGILYGITNTHEMSSTFSEDTPEEFNPDRWQKLLNAADSEDHQLSDSEESSCTDYNDYNANLRKRRSTKPQQQQQQQQHQKKLDRFDFLPFGAGPRRCIGSPFAKLFLKVFIIELCTTYRWKMLNEKPEIKTAPLPFPKDGLPLVFRNVVEK